MDMDSGMVRMSSYPFAAATIARPMPVFPLWGGRVRVCGCDKVDLQPPRQSVRQSVSQSVRKRSKPTQYATKMPTPTPTNLVGSTSTVFPGAMSPRFSASVIILVLVGVRAVAK